MAVQEDNKKNESIQNKDRKLTAELISFAYNIGFAIIIPIIIFVVSGRLIDKKLNSSPIYLLVGLALSFITTSFIIMKKIKEISKDIK